MKEKDFASFNTTTMERKSNYISMIMFSIRALGKSKGSVSMEPSAMERESEFYPRITR
jgi:hypothetical protein